jgi:hypothetical protein
MHAPLRTALLAIKNLIRNRQGVSFKKQVGGAVGFDSKSAGVAQGNRVKESGSDEACEEIIVPSGGFALEALRVLAGHFTDEIVCHVL